MEGNKSKILSKRFDLENEKKCLSLKIPIVKNSNIPSINHLGDLDMYMYDNCHTSKCQSI